MSKDDVINLVDKKGFIIFFFLLCNKTYYQRNKEAALNKAENYYKNHKEKLTEQARNKCRNLPEEEEIKRENIEKTDIIIC